jgi:hypothetical protein
VGVDDKKSEARMSKPRVELDRVEHLASLPPLRDSSDEKIMLAADLLAEEFRTSAAAVPQALELAFRLAAPPPAGPELENYRSALKQVSTAYDSFGKNALRYIDALRSSGDPQLAAHATEFHDDLNNAILEARPTPEDRGKRLQTLLIAEAQFLEQKLLARRERDEAIFARDTEFELRKQAVEKWNEGRHERDELAREVERLREVLEACPGCQEGNGLRDRAEKAEREIERLAELVGAVKRVCLYVANRIGQTKLSTEALRQALAIAAEHGDANEWIAELELLLALRALDAKGGK